MRTLAWLFALALSLAMAFVAAISWKSGNWYFIFAAAVGFGGSTAFLLNMRKRKC